MDGFTVHGERFRRLVTPLLAMGWFFSEGMRVNVGMTHNHKGLKQNHESHLILGL